MALMMPCADSNENSDLWIFDSVKIANPALGSTICLKDWPSHCLAAQADHEHAGLIVTRNAEHWYYNQEDETIRLAPANKFAVRPCFAGFPVCHPPPPHAIPS
jgi:hypothetical protein